MLVAVGIFGLCKNEMCNFACGELVSPAIAYRQITRIIPMQSPGRSQDNCFPKCFNTGGQENESWPALWESGMLSVPKLNPVDGQNRG